MVMVLDLEQFGNSRESYGFLREFRVIYSGQNIVGTNAYLDNVRNARRSLPLNFGRRNEISVWSALGTNGSLDDLIRIGDYNVRGN